MESVPESSEMDAFRTSPIPQVRISSPLVPKPQTLRHKAGSQNLSPHSQQLDIPNFSHPNYMRRATDPSPSLAPSPWAPNPNFTPLPFRPLQPRANSPLSRGHTRSQSAASTIAPPPPMARAKSLPSAPYFAQSPIRPSSPAGSPHRQRALRKSADEVFPQPQMPMRGLKLDKLDTTDANASSIPEEDEETPKASGFERSTSPGLYPGVAAMHSRPRRPSSPLKNYTLGQDRSGGSSPSSVASSPLYQSTRYDGFSGYNFPPSSSVPTTPNSLRSRSPSISSLETIPDSPDAEEAALEADRIAMLKAAAEAEDGSSGSDGEGMKQGNDGIMGRGRRMGSIGRDKSKRWSVCGAERRQDLDLETIWED